MSLRGWSHVSPPPNKSNTADGCHPEFRKTLIAACTGLRYLHKIWFKDATRPRPSKQKRNRALIRMTSSVERREQNVGHSQTYMNQIWYRAQETMCQIRVS